MMVCTTAATDPPLAMIELAPVGETEAHARRLLDEQLAYVWSASSFYRRAWGDAGIMAPPTADRLSELPFTTKDQLRDAQDDDAPFGTVRAAAADDVVRLHLTSGTTGRPLAIAFTADDLRWSTEVGSRAFWAAGVRPGDVVLHCLNYAFYVGGLADHLAIEATGATVVPVGVGQSARLLTLWDWLRPTAMFCTPSYASHLATAAREAGRDPAELGLRLIVTGGEPGGDVAAVRERIETEWQAQVADAYGMGEVWPTFAGHCRVRDGVHLTAPEALWWELVNPDTGDPLLRDEGATGEIVYTHLQRRAMPLVRYRSGDVVEVAAWDCPCGRRTPRVRLQGRADQMFQAKGVNVFPQAVHELLAELVPGLGDFALLIDAPAPSGSVPLFVECASPHDPGLTEHVAAEIRLRLQVSCHVHLTELGGLALGGEHKTRRVFRTYLGEEIPGLSHPKEQL